MGLIDLTESQTSPADLEALARQPSLTRTCQYLRKDLLPYFYGNTLVIKISALCQGGKRWLEAIGVVNRRCLDKVYIVAEWPHLLRPLVGQKVVRYGPLQMMVGSSRKECWTLGLISYYRASIASNTKVFARKITFLA